MRLTSSITGTLSKTTRPLIMGVAHKIATVEFLVALVLILPCSFLPPWTTKPDIG